MNELLIFLGIFLTMIFLLLFVFFPFMDMFVMPSVSRMAIPESNETCALCYNIDGWKLFGMWG